MTQPNEIHTAVREYIEAGLFVTSIPYGSKGPTTPGWQLKENAVSSITQIDQVTENVGLLHAYSGTCALDIDDLEGTREALWSHGVDLNALLNHPDAVRIVSGRPNRAKLLYRTDRIRQTRSIRHEGKSVAELRCAAKNGNSVQDVLPPSIHKDTGQPYRWEGDWRHLPHIPPEIAKIWDELESGKQTRTYLKTVEWVNWCT